MNVGGQKPEKMLLTFKNNQLAGDLGAADRLEVTWKSAQASSATAVLASEGVIQVHIDSRQVATSASLTLRVLGGQVRQWRVLVPKGAEVKVVDAEARVSRIETSEQKQVSLRTIHLKEASADSLTIAITSTQPAPKPGAGKPTPIGPFTVLGAVRQSGSVLVSNSVADWHLDFTPHGDLTRRGASEEELRQNSSLSAAFRYGPGGGGGNGRGAISWLDLEAETVRGKIKTSSAHLLLLATDGPGPRWKVQTTITVTPRWADVDHFSVQLPSDCNFDGDEGRFPLPDRVKEVRYNPATHVVAFKLARGGAEPSLQPFPVKIEGTYTSAIKTSVADSVRLALPRPLGTIEQDGSLTVTAPANLELLPVLDPPGGLKLLRQSMHEQVWSYPRLAPERVEASWRPYRPPVSVASLADVTLSGGEGRVHQELRYELPGNALPQPGLQLRVPASAGNLRVQGAELVRETSGAGGPDPIYRLVPADPRRPGVILDFTFPLAAGPAVSVPLAAPHMTSRGTGRVRIWSEGNLPTTSSAGWAEQNIEDVPGRNRLPVLVLHAARPDQPLTLRTVPGGAAFTVLIERALVRVDIGDAGLQTYRVSYRLSRLTSRRLDFELPAPVPTINLEVRLDGKRVDPELIDSDQPELKRRLVRLRLSPDLVRKPAVLELSYQLAPDRTGSTAVTTTLQAPRALGDPGSVPMRWTVTAPRSWVVVAPEAGPGTARVWGRRGWLLAPRSNLTGIDLERWLIDAEPSAAVTEAAASLNPTLVLWRDGDPALHITHAPQQVWLVGCSLGLVLLGLVLSRLPFTRATGGPPLWAWLLLAGLLAALVLGALLWPTLAGQIVYGCQPGAAVLLLIALIQWFLHERYRRQIIFLPSFSRAHTGSSLLRKEPIRPHGEPSTVDAPRQPGSSINR